MAINESLYYTLLRLDFKFVDFLFHTVFSRDVCVVDVNDDVEDVHAEYQLLKKKKKKETGNTKK